MKSLALSSLALALAFACAPAMASHPDAADAAVSTSSATLTAPDGTWTLLARNARFSPDDLATRTQALIDQGQPPAEALAAVYQDADAAFVRIGVVAQTRTLTVYEGTATIQGPYAAYFPGARVADGVAVIQHPRQSALEAFARRVNDRARADVARATIAIDADGEAGDVVVNTATEVLPPDTKRFQGSVGYTNNGARYAGADLLTGSMRFQGGTGNELAINASRGLPNVRDDSYGGRYNSAGLAFSHAGPNGTTRMAASHVDYVTGGPLRVFDLTGKVDTISVFHTAAVSQEWSVYGGLTSTKATTNLGAGGLNWGDTTRYRTATIGATRQGKASALNVQVDRGLGGSRSVDMVPLQGAFDPHYWSVKADVVGERNLNDDGWKVRAGASAQVSSTDTPSNEQFTIGGPLRGQAFLGGAASGNRGYSAFAEVAAPARNGFTPYAGVDHSWVSPGHGQDMNLSSAYLGVRARPHARVNLDLGYARAIGGAPEGVDKGRVFATATVSF